MKRDHVCGCVVVNWWAWVWVSLTRHKLVPLEAALPSAEPLAQEDVRLIHQKHRLPLLAQEQSIIEHIIHMLRLRPQLARGHHVQRHLGLLGDGLSGESLADARRACESWTCSAVSMGKQTKDGGRGFTYRTEA